MGADMPNNFSESPAVAELKSALRGVLPSVVLGTVRMDKSRHTSGLAIDIMLDSKTPDEKFIADAIIAALIDTHGQSRWSDLIYTDWTDKGDPDYFHIPGGGHGYGGKPLQKNPIDKGTGAMHVNHIHLDWVDFGLKSGDVDDPFTWSSDAKRTGFSGAFQAALQGYLATTPVPTAKGSAPAWLLGWWKVKDSKNDLYYYYFGEAGFAYWTDDAPKSPLAAKPLVGMHNRATIEISKADGLVISWDSYGTVETFRAVAGKNNRAMSGTSNYGDVLTASKV
jgi:hypothetical protein